MSLGNTGVIICGGGFRYFTNAWIVVRMLRMLGNRLPIEIWVWEHEHDPKLQVLVDPFNVVIRVAEVPEIQRTGLPNGARWQWALKPYALLNSAFRHVLMLDADNFPIVDPEYLFETVQYRDTGAIFWPDVGRTEKERPIWKIMGIPYRDEPEFESGQMLIDTEQHKAPLEHAFRMNLEADTYYNIIWGDKDTFRFAWHKYGRSYSMTHFPLQMLNLPGGKLGSWGVMCQHDFNGNRIFQHRNMAKWSLLGENPRIPGYIFENESRKFLCELRNAWDGRICPIAVDPSDYSSEQWMERTSLVELMTNGNWLVEDRRPRPSECCGPIIEWCAESPSQLWGEVDMKPTAEDNKTQNLDTSTILEHATLSGLSLINEEKSGFILRDLRRREIQLMVDGTIKDGDILGVYWWELRFTFDKWRLSLLGEEGILAELAMRTAKKWEGTWAGEPQYAIMMQREEDVFGFQHGGIMHRDKPDLIGQILHVANHAFGIGDAITGFYSAAALAASGQPIIYHTRFPDWLGRASHPLVTITNDAPPQNTIDIDCDYAEQIRYCKDKVKWCANKIASTKMEASLSQVCNGANHTSSGITINQTVKIPRLDFEKYIIFAPFASVDARNWPEAHWRRLSRLLVENGYDVVAIGGRDDAERMENTFNSSYVYWAIDHDCSWVMDVMLQAEVVIGVDSGMMHLAGLLKVPGICIHSHLPPEFLFSCAPSIQSLTPNANCSFCRWQPDRGYRGECASNCSAIALVAPEAVLAAVHNIKNVKTSP